MSTQEKFRVEEELMPSHGAKPQAYAIDFGTSNSLLIAVSNDGLCAPFELDTAAPDPTILKSVIFSPSPDKWFFGAHAIEQYTEHLGEGRLFRSVKKYLPDASFTGTQIHGKYVNLTELVAVFLREMRRRANDFYQVDVKAVVLGRPAAFSLDAEKDELAQKRLEAAARLAGFEQIEFCPEPIAAAYEFRHQLTEPKTVLIADFGGGTSDFTVLKLSRESFKQDDVLSLGGLPVAGDMFDGALMKNMIAPHFGTNIIYRLPTGSVDLRMPQHLINKMCSPADISFLTKSDIMSLLKDAQRWSLPGVDAKRMERLFVLAEEHLGYKIFRAIEASKVELSTQESTKFRFDYPGIEIEEELLNADFKACSQPTVDKIIHALDKTVKAASLRPEDIDIVCCTGGTAKIPALSYELAQRFGVEKLRQHRHFHSVIGGLAERAQAMIA